MDWLPDGENISKISLFVFAQPTNVTDGRTDRHRVTAIAAQCIASHGKNWRFVTYLLLSGGRNHYLLCIVYFRAINWFSSQKGINYSIKLLACYVYLSV